VLDAQNFGVAQRRRWVFVVGHLGDWKPAAEVLFEPESLRGDIKKGRGEGEDIAYCLTKSPSSYSSYNPARGEGNAVITYNITFCDANGRRKDRPKGGLYVNKTEISSTLTKSGIGTNAVEPNAIRRLTPMECERLQGFPDSYTNIPKAADSNRYKALGNSMAVPVMRWIGERINQYEQRGMEKHL